MKLTVWGARGSIPVSGPDYLRYGGDTTCAEIETKSGEVIILDAGTGLRALGNKMVAEGRREFHFVLSHAHWDHLMGFPFFKPLYRADSTLYFHGCSHAQNSLQAILEETMREPFFPVALSEVQAQLVFDPDCKPEFEIADLCCASTMLNHPNYGYGFRFHEGERTIAFFPDNELSFHHPEGGDFKDYAEFLKDVDLVMHDGEYLPEEYERVNRGWGHSTYRETVELGLAAGCGHLVIWHLNQERTDDHADEILADARRLVAESGADMGCDLAFTGLEVEVG